MAYFIFIVWLIILNLIISGLDFGFIEALRQIPRFIFLIGIVQFFLIEKGMREKILKIVVMYSLFVILIISQFDLSILVTIGLLFSSNIHKANLFISMIFNHSVLTIKLFEVLNSTFVKSL